MAANQLKILGPPDVLRPINKQRAAWEAAEAEKRAARAAAKKGGAAPPSPVYAFIVKYGLGGGEARPTVNTVREVLNGFLESAGRDDLIGIAQIMPPEVGGPYNPRIGTQAAKIIKTILDLLKANEPTFR